MGLIPILTAGMSHVLSLWLEAFSFSSAHKVSSASCPIYAVSQLLLISWMKKTAVGLLAVAHAHLPLPPKLSPFFIPRSLPSICLIKCAGKKPAGPGARLGTILLPLPQVFLLRSHSRLGVTLLYFSFSPLNEFTYVRFMSSYYFWLSKSSAAEYSQPLMVQYFFCLGGISHPWKTCHLVVIQG